MCGRRRAPSSRVTRAGQQAEAARRRPPRSARTAAAARRRRRTRRPPRPAASRIAVVEAARLERGHRRRARRRRPGSRPARRRRTRAGSSLTATVGRRPARAPRAASAGCPRRSRRSVTLTARPSCSATPGARGSRATAPRSASASRLERGLDDGGGRPRRRPRRCRPSRPRRASVSRKWGKRLAGDLADRARRASASSIAGHAAAREVDRGLAPAPRRAARWRRAKRRRPGAVAERLVERLAERDRAVLDRVVLVDPEVAPTAQVEVEHRPEGRAP